MSGMYFLGIINTITLKNHEKKVSVMKAPRPAKQGEGRVLTDP